MKKVANRPRSPSIYSEFLRWRPSFLTGIASIFDFAGNLHRYEYDSGPDADARALASDWQAIRVGISPPQALAGGVRAQVAADDGLDQEGSVCPARP